MDEYAKYFDKNSKYMNQLMIKKYYKNPIKYGVD